VKQSSRKATVLHTSKTPPIGHWKGRGALHAPVTAHSQGIGARLGQLSLYRACGRWHSAGQGPTASRTSPHVPPPLLGGLATHGELLLDPEPQHATQHHNLQLLRVHFDVQSPNQPASHVHVSQR
jgi:hypothetical protein